MSWQNNKIIDAVTSYSKGCILGLSRFQKLFSFGVGYLGGKQKVG